MAITASGQNTVASRGQIVGRPDIILNCCQPCAACGPLALARASAAGHSTKQWNKHAPFAFCSSRAEVRLSLPLSSSNYNHHHHRQRTHSLQAMPFPFSFNFAVPGVANPFTSNASLRSASVMPQAKSVDILSEKTRTSNLSIPGEVPRRPISPCLAPPQPLAKKRGWVPSSAAPTVSPAVETAMNGYLDSPSKYRDFAPQHGREDDDIDEMMGGESPVVDSDTQACIRAMLNEIKTRSGVTVGRTNK